MTDDTSAVPFVPITPNPFIVGNPVRDPSMFFGRESDFELVRARFEGSSHGGLIVFCGERRSGKTSILFQILAGRLGPSFIPVLIDMQSMAIASEQDFLERLAQEVRSALGAIGETLRPPDFESCSKPSTAFYRFIEALVRSHPDHRPILLFDEYELFENKIESGTLTADVLNILSSLMERQSLFLVFTGSQHLEQRRGEYWRILQKSTYYRTISYLQKEDTFRLIQVPVAGRVTYAEGIVEAIYRLSAGQPFYTQAICQSLVDCLNERRTRHVTREILDSVVESIVDNPFPQMIFLWDGLEKDEKLVLALLAETLPDSSTHVPVARLAAPLAEGKHPVDLSASRIASGLEALFTKELLLKDRGEAPGYAFRMDLWRLWIRRMHSIWQVVRELGIAVSPPPARSGFRGRRWWVLPPAITALVVAAAIVVPRLFSLGGGRLPAQQPLPQPAGEVLLTIDPRPPSATILVDEREASTGAQLTRGFRIGETHKIRVTAVGYVDTSFAVQFNPDSPGSVRSIITLRARVGGLRIGSVPSGAAVRVDNRPSGRTPVVLDRVPVVEPHVVEVSLAGYATQRREITVTADSITDIRLTLVAPTVQLRISSTPPGAAVTVDGRSHGVTPITVANLPPGRHRVAAILVGHVSIDTLLDVAADPVPLRLALSPGSPGAIIIKGDHPAVMLIDDQVVSQNVQNSGRRAYPPGRHKITVRPLSGPPVEHVIVVNSRELVEFDYTRNEEVSRTPIQEN